MSNFLDALMTPVARRARRGSSPTSKGVRGSAAGAL